MHDFDASSIIYGWDNYPVGQFPALWAWLDDAIQNGEFAILEVAYKEVRDKCSECAEWLESNDIQRLKVTEPILREALRIKNEIGIIEEQYHPKGVDENDLLIIAAAKLSGDVLVTDESKQPRPPDIRSKMKIPAVCDIPSVNVGCMTFLEVIKASNKVFK